MDSAAKAPNITKLIVGLDLGTTNSAVAFGTLEDAHPIPLRSEVSSVAHWPGPRPSTEIDEVKVPSKIQYRRGENGHFIPDKWGYQVEHDDDLTFDWYKLLLLKDEDQPRHLRDSKQLQKAKERMRVIGKTSEDVVSDYLSKLWEHAVGEKSLDPWGLPTGQICSLLGKGSVYKMPIHVVLTVPAIWGKYARELMKKAAVRAGIFDRRRAGPTTLELISEPEAAAYTYAKEIRQRLGVGDTILVLDLGGGTGDSTSYKLLWKDGSGNLELEEVIPCDGELCGAIFLDEAFMELLKKVLSSNPNRPTTAAGWRKLLHNEWEMLIKRRFAHAGGEVASPWKVDLSAAGDYVLLSNDQIRDVFEKSVVPKIIELVKSQIEGITKETGKGPAVILLVGGFGRSPYIRHVLEREFGSKKRKRHPGSEEEAAQHIQTEVLSDTGDRPWSAISKGAVDSVENRINSRVARLSVGFQHHVEASKEEGGTWHATFGRNMKDSMIWVVKKGERVSNCHKILAEKLVFRHGASGEAVHLAKFFAHGDKNPPGRLGSGHGFSHYGEMAIEAPMSIQYLPLRSGEGGRLTHEFDYELHIKSSGASIDITAMTVDASPRKVGELVLDMQHKARDGLPDHANGTKIKY